MEFIDLIVNDELFDGEVSNLNRNLEYDGIVEKVGDVCE